MLFGGHLVLLLTHAFWDSRLNENNANTPFFHKDLSRFSTKSISMGLAAINTAKKILLIANDASKTRTIASLFTGDDFLDPQKQPSKAALIAVLICLSATKKNNAKRTNN